MARQARLKVYRTAIGFHDAYVAAPSQKAALAAWGSEGNLFAQGLAEAVTDPALMSEALAAPGKVLRRSRGSSREQLAALDETPAKVHHPIRETEPESAAPSEEKQSDALKRIKAGVPKPPRPRPSRRPIERSEARLDEAQRRHAAELAKLVERERQLNRERRALQRRHAAETERLERALDKARKRYQQAIHDNAV